MANLMHIPNQCYGERHNLHFDPTFDAGVSFLIGYSFKVSDKSQLMLQAFSNRGVVDLHNYSIGSQRNNTFGLLVSWMVH